jgi:hypothetical protein
LLTVLLTSGCAALELADMVFDDDCKWRGTVETVSSTPKHTIVTFQDGHTETCNRADWIKPGDWIVKPDM